MAKLEDRLKDIDLEEEKENAINEMGELNKSKKKKDDDDDILVSTSFLETEDYILEQINSCDTTTLATSKTNRKFIVFNKKTGTTEEKSTFEYKNKVYQPIDSELLTQGIISLPKGVEEYGTTIELVEEIKEFLYEYFEAPGFFKELLPYIILFYWVYDEFPFIPYLHFLGRTGTGKTTAMEVVGSICYKPIDASGAVSMASIFRIASQWKGTLLLDEFNPAGENYREMLTLLKTGVSDRAVLRVEGDKKKEVVGFLIKSPKIFTSENPTNDAGLRSRVLEIRMEKNKKRVPLYRQLGFKNKAEQLQKKLLLWRLRKLIKIDLSEINQGFEALQCFDGRVQQVITPIYYLADDESKKKILKFAIEQQDETLRERRESIDGQSFIVIHDYYKKGNEPALTDISEILNKGSKYPISEKKLGNAVRKILGFDIQRLGHDNISTVISSKDHERVEELCEYYGIKFEKYEADEDDFGGIFNEK